MRAEHAAEPQEPGAQGGLVASRGRALPPSTEDVALYLTYLSSEINTAGSATETRQALGVLATVNANRGWGRDSMLGGRAAVPVEAL